MTVVLPCHLHTPGFDIGLRSRKIPAVLREIKNVRQEQMPGRRRWFESEHMDLIVWLDPAERMTGFQICYASGLTEKALTWRDGVGFAHNAIDSGSRSPISNQTPILLPGGKAPWSHIRRLFEDVSPGLEPALRELIRSRLNGEPGE